MGFQSELQCSKVLQRESAQNEVEVCHEVAIMQLDLAATASSDCTAAMATMSGLASQLSLVQRESQLYFAEIAVLCHWSCSNLSCDT